MAERMILSERVKYDAISNSSSMYGVCPICKEQAKLTWNDDSREVMSIKHFPKALDEECPATKKFVNPQERNTNLVSNYKAVEFYGVAAKEALRKKELAESRLDGRDGRPGYVSSSEALSKLGLK
jgi:hypothetical protein